MSEKNETTDRIRQSIHVLYEFCKYPEAMYKAARETHIAAILHILALLASAGTKTQRLERLVEVAKMMGFVQARWFCYPRHRPSLILSPSEEVDRGMLHLDINDGGVWLHRHGPDMCADDVYDTREEAEKAATDDENG